MLDNIISWMKTSIQFRSKNKDIAPEQIIAEYEKLPLFNRIVNFASEFGVLPGEIRRYNVGIAPDGRFVIIDSSIGDTINL